MRTIDDFVINRQIKQPGALTISLDVLQDLHSVHDILHRDCDSDEFRWEHDERQTLRDARDSLLSNWNQAAVDFASDELERLIRWFGGNRLVCEIIAAGDEDHFGDLLAERSLCHRRDTKARKREHRRTT